MFVYHAEGYLSTNNYGMDFGICAQHGFYCYNLASQYGELGCALSFPYKMLTVFLVLI